MSVIQNKKTIDESSVENRCPMVWSFGKDIHEMTYFSSFIEISDLHPVKS
jgi:hypothetical protein